MKRLLLYLLAFHSIAQNAHAQKGRGYLIIDAGPKVCITQNRALVAYSEQSAKAGLGFDAHLGYGRTLPKYGAFVEMSLGYASYRLSPDARQMDLYLNPNSFSHQFDFLQTSLKIGFIHKISNARIKLAPYVGIRWLFYLPEESVNSDWVYVNDERVQTHDLLYARYSKNYGISAYHAFVLTGGIKVHYPISQKMTFTAAPFFDMGFKIIRDNFFLSERNNDRNPDENNRLSSTSKGDCIGLEFGLNYQPFK